MRRKAELGRRTHARSDSLRPRLPRRVSGRDCSRAQEPNPLIAVRADRWADAQADAARFADPVAEKLVLYLRLRAPGAATSAEIADFMQRNPDWPAQAMLERRRQEAIATDPDDAVRLLGPVQSQHRPRWPPPCCAAPRPPPTPAAVADADALARRAWVDAIDFAARRGRLPPPLGRRRHAGRPVGSFPAPRLASDPVGRRAPGRPPRSGPSRGCRGPPRCQTRGSADRSAGRRPAARACAPIRA